MTVIASEHENYDVTFESVAERRYPRHYGRPARTHRAVRNGVGVIEHARELLVLEGEDRIGFLDNVVSNRVPTADGDGCYAVLCDPQGKIRADLSIFTTPESLLVLAPPGMGEPIGTEWREHVFIEDVTVSERTDEFGLFGVHGPRSTEKVASVLTGASPPAEHGTFVRGQIGDDGVTVIRSDDPTGEAGYTVVCASEVARQLFDSLLTHGMGAVPFGSQTWESLTLEAGTPLFDTELEGQIPNVCGLRHALDFEKGCYVGQEVVSRVENRGQPSSKLVGLELDAMPAAGDEVLADRDSVGEITRAARSPLRETPIAVALVESGLEAAPVVVRTEDGAEATATPVQLPFVETSSQSLRTPTYE